jgi:uncharacterized protein
MSPFEWDEEKAASNRAVHNIAFETAVLIFEGPLVETEDTRKDYGETRWIAIGAVAGREITVVYTWRGQTRRIISARRAHPKERRDYRAVYPLRDDSG